MRSKQAEGESKAHGLCDQYMRGRRLAACELSLPRYVSPAYGLELVPIYETIIDAATNLNPHRTWPCLLWSLT